MPKNERYSAKKDVNFKDLRINDLTQEEVDKTYERLLDKGQIVESGIHQCWTIPSLKTKGDGYLQIFVHGYLYMDIKKNSFGIILL
jgi:hypothetical protein